MRVGGIDAEVAVREHIMYAILFCREDNDMEGLKKTCVFHEPLELATLNVKKSFGVPYREDVEISSHSEEISFTKSSPTCV